MPDMSPSCGADELQALVGQDAAVLERSDLPKNLRILRPGMAVTADYQPDRLNISISAAEKIDRVWCS